MFADAGRLIMRAIKGACEVSDPRARQAIENLAKSVSDLIGNPGARLNHDPRIINNLIDKTTIGGDVTNIYRLTTTRRGTGIDWFFNEGSGTGDRVLRWSSPPRVRLQANMAANSVSVKIISRISGVDTEVGSAGTAYDVFKRWAHAMTGDEGLLGYDEDGGIPFLYGLNTSDSRYVTLDADLASGDTTHVSGVDINTTQAIPKIYGTFVLATRNIPSATAKVGIRWYGEFDNGDGTYGKWCAVDTDKCSVAA